MEETMERPTVAGQQFGVDITAMREAAEKAPEKPWSGGAEGSHAYVRFQIAANPAAVIAILDRLEAAERRLAEQGQAQGEAARIGDAALGWLVEHRFLDGDDEYYVRDAIEALDSLISEATPPPLEPDAELVRALEPFNTNWTTDAGWSDVAPKNDRICDWFGPSDFRRVSAALRRHRKHGGE